ncbi:MAG: hypothetical protein J0I12_17040 [Candidatus Eremiobacteraeota bacterium]|nr:hypothetical protein [Candidatus Eremiobacteraeota bacterium]
MRVTRTEMAVTLAALAVFLGPTLLRRPPLAGGPDLGMGVARRLLEEMVAAQNVAGRNETFVYGHTAEEPSYYSYSVTSRDLRDGFYQVDVQVRWKGVPETSKSKGSRPMEVHLGRRIKPTT